VGVTAVSDVYKLLSLLSVAYLQSRDVTCTMFQVKIVHDYVPALQVGYAMLSKLSSLYTSLVSERGKAQLVAQLGWLACC